MAQYSRVLGVVLLCGTLVAGCRSALPTASVACVSATLFREPIPQTIENLAANASTIVVGTFTGYGPALWETPDGKRPVTYDAKDPNRPGIVTPLSIDVAGVVQGRREAVGHAVIPGGTVGCDQLFAMERLALDTGQRYVFFLNTNTRQGEVTGFHSVMERGPSARMTRFRPEWRGFALFGRSSENFRMQADAIPPSEASERGRRAATGVYDLAERRLLGVRVLWPHLVALLRVLPVLLGSVLLIATACAPMHRGPDVATPKPPYTLAPPTPTLSPIGTVGPLGAGQPYSAEDLASIVQGAPVGFPVELRTPAVAQVLADRIWSF
jgi:hypothetical protein